MLMPEPDCSNKYQNLGMATIVPPVRSLFTMPAQGCKLSKGLP